MSSDRLQEILESLGEDGNLYEDDPDDPDYELHLDDEDMDDEMYAEDDEDLEDDDEEYDEEEDDEEEDEDEGGGESTFTLQIDPNDDSSGATYLELAALLNGTSGEGSAASRSSLLQRLLAGGLRSRGPAPSQEELRRRRAEDARREVERRRREQWWTPQIKPHPKGAELLRSGEFGRVGQWRPTSNGAFRRPILKEANRWGAVPKMSQVGSSCTQTR